MCVEACLRVCALVRVCLCKRKRACMHLCVYTYYAGMHTYDMHVYVHMCMHVCMHVRKYTQMHALINLCSMNACTHKYMDSMHIKKNSRHMHDLSYTRRCKHLYHVTHMNT